MLCMSSQPNQSFVLPPDVYDEMINWEKRLGLELPFLRAIFSEWGVQRVLDMACGTGRHAAEFHSWGIEVEGADASPEMIHFARSRFGEPPGLKWSIRNLVTPPPQVETFDAALCLGNSLSLVKDETQVKQAVQNLLAAVRPGGIVLIHVLNYGRLKNYASAWPKVTFCSWEGQQILALKGFHRLGEKVLASFTLIDIQTPKVIRAWDEILLCTVFSAAIEAALEEAAAAIFIFQDYDLSSRTAISSNDLLPKLEGQDILILIEKKRS